jgi:hypothetical protein
MRFLIVMALLVSALFAQCHPRPVRFHHHHGWYYYDPVIHRAVPVRIAYVPVRVRSTTQFVPVRIIGTRVIQVRSR